MTSSDNDSWEKYEDDDDLYSPPSSPPPPHIILYPENYHAGSGKSWQHDYAPQVPRYSSNQTTSTSYQSPSTSSSEPDGKNNKVTSTSRFHTTVRRYTLKVIKMLWRAVFTNNNILLAITLGNRLWTRRNSIFIKPYYRFLREANPILLQVKQVLPNNYQEAVMLLKAFQSITLHYYTKSMSHTNKIQSGTKGKKHAILFMLSNLQKLYKISMKLTNKWIAQAIRGIGGLDAFILAIGVVTLTKYLQRSNRIF